MQEKEKKADEVLNTALQIIESHKNDLIYVRKEDLIVTSMFKPEVTVISTKLGDFHEIEGKLMPKSFLTDDIAQFSGVTFIARECVTRKEGQYIWVGRAQGKKRMPDGTWRESQAHEYEFDAELRAEKAILKNPDKYRTDSQKRAYLLKLAEHGRTRAGTGARLKVIRELNGMPISFDPKDVEKNIIVSRIAVNTDKMLECPEMREAAINHALGVAGEIFGVNSAPRNVTPAPTLIEAPEEQEEQEEQEEPKKLPDIGIDPNDIPWKLEPEAAPLKPVDLTAKKRKLQDLYLEEPVQKNEEVRDAVWAMAEKIKSGEATSEEAQALIDKVEKWLQKVRKAREGIKA